MGTGWTLQHTKCKKCNVSNAPVQRERCKCTGTPPDKVTANGSGSVATTAKITESQMTFTHLCGEWEDQIHAPIPRPRNATEADEWVYTPQFTYTGGQCFALALEVERQAGWPAEVWEDDHGNGHVFNRLPNGMLVDIEGTIDEDEVEEEELWEGFQPRPEVREEDPNFEDWGEYDPELAKEWATKLIRFVEALEANQTN